METTQLRQFVAVASEGHLGRAATSLGVSRAVLRESLDAVEAAVGGSLVIRTGDQVELTPDGERFLVTAREEVAAADTAAAPPKANTGGKAKASKGKGRAPKVKGQPLPYKKRQSR
ncbi:LysR family transcriptional regulator [Agromyces salentinus]|uniref:HTH lysR-type domain-containing protein n=1 Tax=Agromyces salentinus TaxID=269421 RepID=A0ABP4YVA1_9MICO|nr:LysR family transcriptional regulator [Agromyces salentinus]